MNLLILTQRDIFSFYISPSTNIFFKGETRVDQILTALKSELLNKNDLLSEAFLGKYRLRERIQTAPVFN